MTAMVSSPVDLREKGGHRGRGRHQQSRTMLIPIAAVCLVLGIYPIAQEIYVGFTNERVGGTFGTVPTRFVGIANYQSIFADPQFLQGLLLILGLGVVVVAITYVLAYLQSTLLTQEFPFRRVVRTIALIPLAVAPVIVGQVFRYLYDPNLGAVNGLLETLHLESSAQFLPYSSLGLFWLALPGIWVALPFATVFLLASMQSVSQEVMEAAKMDGAGPIRRFWVVVFPETRGALAAIIPLSFATQLLAFDVFFAVLGGQLSAISSSFFIPSIYEFYDISEGLVGRASATATVILILTLIAFAISRYINSREGRRA